MSVVLQARSGADGKLHLEVPGYPPGMDYQVTIHVRPKPAMTPEEWKAVVLSLAGSITDPTFERPPQLPLEERCGRASRVKFDAVLAKVPDEPPLPGDELPG